MLTNTASRLQTAAAPGEILIERRHRRHGPRRGGDRAGAGAAPEGQGAARPGLAGAPSRSAPPTTAPRPVRRRSSAGPMSWTNWRTASGGCCRQRQVCLVTVLGTPGTREVAAGAGVPGHAARRQATVLSARCPAYGQRHHLHAAGRDAVLLSRRVGGAQRGAARQTRDLGSRAARSLASDHGPGPPPMPGRRPADAAGVEEIAWAVRHLLDVVGQGAAGDHDLGGPALGRADPARPHRRHRDLAGGRAGPAAVRGPRRNCWKPGRPGAAESRAR